MGGHIAASGRVGEGLIFAVILPLPSLEPDWTKHDAA
jgi:signal transduction histidine kinase